MQAAVEQPAQNLIESLESRRMLSVSMNSAGWTVVTPAANSRLIYVSSSSGSDNNTGLSASAPLATIAKAYTLLRNGYPDWILLERGDTFDGSFSYFSDSGQDAQDPMVITYYGNPSLPRPIVDSGPNIAFRTGKSNSYLDLIGIDFTTSTHDPSSPNYTGQGDYGLYDLGGTTDMLVEDCSFSDFLTDITFQGFYAPLYNITVRRDQILDSWDASGGHSEGMYADTTTNLTIEDDVFDHDGWNTDVPGAQATIYNQDCYLHSSNSNCVVIDNVFADAASFGLQARAGGIVDDNLFVNDPYGFSFGLVNGATTKAGGVSGQVIGNVVLDPRSDPSGWGIGAMIGNLTPGGGTTVADNIFAGDPNGNNPAIDFQPGVGVSNPSQEVGLNTLVFSNNVVDGWGFGLEIAANYVPGTTGSDGLTAVVVRNNDFQNNVTGRVVSHGDIYDPRFEDWSGNVYSSTTVSPSSMFSLEGSTISFAAWQASVEPTAVDASIPFVDAARNVASYMTTQGMTGTVAAYITALRGMDDSNWNPVYLAATVNLYVQGGFIVDTTPPVAVATPPPDVTPANYQTTPAPTFTVTYTDQAAINPASLNSNNITIAGEGGYTLPVTLVSTSGTGASITATYQVTPTNGDWTTVPFGTYVISLASGQVSDSSGNVAVAQPLASFQVTVNPQTVASTAAATTPVGVTATAGASSITVSWTDPAEDQTSFILQRALDSAFTQQVQSYPLTGDATSYTDISAAVGTTYYYQLIAVNPVGASAPTAAATAAILPPAPALSNVILDDGNALRTAITSATLVFTEPVTVTPAMVSLIQNPATTAVPMVVSLSNPTSDGKTWIVSWTSNQDNNALPDGSYSLTVHGAMVTDAFGQSAGGDQTTNFKSAVGPVVTNVVYGNLAPPHTLSFTFNEDVSASLTLAALKLVNSSNQVVAPASVAWNAATDTATWTFASALPDGNYAATLYGSVLANSDGVHLDGGNVGIPGVNYTFNFTEAKPTLAISGAANVNIGAPYTLNLGAISDGAQVNPEYLVHWGDGNTSTYTSAGAVTYNYSSAAGPIKITVDVIDANGTHANCASLSLSVNRATIALSGAANANPTAPYSLTLGAVTDIGYTVSQYIVHWGDGSTSTYTAAGVVQHTYATPKSATAETISVDLVDNGGIGGANFTNLSVASLPVTLNATPSVPTTGSLNANAGGLYRLILGTPVDNGFTVSQLSINWGDGSPIQTVAAGTTLATHTFTTATAPGVDTITIGLTDNTGTYANTGTMTTTVNPAPTVALTGNPNANVGGSYSLNLAAAVDVGQTVTAYTIHWGDSSANTVVSSPGNVSHVYSTAGPENIAVDVTDGTGTFASAGSMSIAVNNQPTIALSGNPNANVNGVYTLNLGAVSDPGQTVSGYLIHWGDGQTTTSAVGGPITHTYTASGSDTISVDLTDGSGTYTAAGTMAVNAAQPSLDISGNNAVFVGQSYSLTVGPPNDLGGTPLQYIIHWGDGTSNSYSTTGVVSHVYATAQLKTLITADLVDTTGTFADAGSQSLIVAPPATVALSGSSNANVGGTYTLNLGAVTDKAATVTGLTVNWGDGTSNSYGAAGGPVTHVYTASGPENITVSVVDQLGVNADAASRSITVNKPAITVSGASTATISAPYALTLGAVFDPGQTVSKYTVHWGDGQTSNYVAAGAVQHAYASSGNYRITVDLTDGEGTYLSVGSPLTVQVASAPTATLTGSAYANAAGTYTLSIGNVSDSFGTPSSYTIHWGDGASISTSNVTSPLTHNYSATGPETISLDITDPGGTWTSVATLGVTVASAPAISLSGNANANATGIYTLNLGAVTDFGGTVSQYAVHWGDGQTTDYSAGGAVTHSYSIQSIGAQTIAVDLTDGTGVYVAAGKLAVSVNPAPTIVLSGNSSANAGGTYSLTLGAVTDPGYKVTNYTVNWGDGQSNSYSAAGVVTHTYGGSGGNENISVALTDPTGVYASAGSLSVNVIAGPTIALSGNADANAGGVYTLNLGAATDPAGAISQYTINWGDGQSTVVPVSASDNQAVARPAGSVSKITHDVAAFGAFTHTYASPGSANISVTITDSTGVFPGAGTLAVTVNPAPTIALSGNSGVIVNGTYSLTLGAVTDPGYTVSQYTVNWGDGQTTNYTAGGTVTHSYSSPGSDTISVAITDPTGTYTTVDPQAVMVNATPPTVALGGNADANAGGTYSLWISTGTDPDGIVSQYTINWGDGQSSIVPISSSATRMVMPDNDMHNNVVPAGTFTHTYASPGNEAITVDITDSSGFYAGAGNLAVTVNPSPTIAVTGNSKANAGGIYALNLGAVSDPGYTVTQYAVNWGDGQITDYAAGGPVTHVYKSGGNAPISVSLTDATGTYSSAGSLAVTVDSDPTVTLSGASSAGIGVPYSLNIAGYSDPGYTVSQYTVHWGDGQSNTYTAGGVVNHTYATAGADAITVDLTDSTGVYTDAGTLNVSVNTAVVGRYVFYNNSYFNGYQTAPGTADFAAIAPDKQALLPGQTASFQNITSYTRGIDGIIVDLAGLPAKSALSAADFSFLAGNSSTPSAWTVAPEPAAVAVFPGVGANGSTRVVITFADNSIVGEWLQVSVLPTVNTGLASADVFYFGNAPGDSGTTPGSAQVTVADYTAARANQSVSSASITNDFDFNRDGVVNLSDALAARSDETTTSTMLELIDPPAPVASSASSKSASANGASAHATAAQSSSAATTVSKTPSKAAFDAFSIDDVLRRKGRRI